MVVSDELIMEDLDIPAKPDLLIEIDNHLKEQEPCLASLSAIIARDVAVSAQILKIINSSAYGLSKPMANIRQAVAYIGISGTINIVKSFALKQSVLQEQCALNLGRFWDTAEELANACLYIGKQVKSDVPEDYFYVFGLFHNIGVPIMACNFAKYPKVLAKANEDNRFSLVQLEQKVFQTQHTKVGYHLACSWNLPNEISQVIRHHHNRRYLAKVDDPICAQLYAVFQLAENLLSQDRRFIDAPDWPYVEKACLDLLHIDQEEYEHLQEELSDLMREVVEF
ncbi:hypothetical protein C2869_09135 [Saccharobesus litoralis]|uniref:HDOD domain-containing protein n=1 Tax=Saccharobesus litoralis TaxID=2172099 RepID=A0A2S0VQV8_9ALTE|nr:HDOD domain-containing protein [Saccharobesus litoralis]AWB66584.1 hypothetical protein C2869_09135 [Saccharobesus litoralis]